MGNLDEKSRFIISKLEEMNCCGMDTGTFLSRYVYDKTYKILSENPEINKDEFYKLMDMNYINFVHDYLIAGEALLVRFTDDLKLMGNHEIYGWLNEHGFSCKKGFWDDCSWVFVDLINKVYYPGRPGVQYMKPAYDHSINEDEFYTIMHMLEFYDEVTTLEHSIFELILERKYKSIFEPEEPSKFEMQEFIYNVLSKMGDNSVISHWSCTNERIKKCYSLLKENSEITYREYLKQSGYLEYLEEVNK